MAQIKMLTGVVEVGLFCKMAQAAYFGNAVSSPVFFFLRPNAKWVQDGSVTIRWKGGKVEQIAPENASS